MEIQKNNNRVLYTTSPYKDKTMVYVLRGEQGDLLIDTGHQYIVHEIDRWIQKNDFHIKWIFLTHGHFDHTWNCRFFKQKYGCETIIHEKDRLFLAQGDVRHIYASSAENEELAKFGNEIVENVLAPYCKVDHAITDADGDFLRKLGFDADIIFLPGHTAGSMGILKGRTLYCGDACSAVGGEFFTAFIGEVPELIKPSEEKMFALNPLVFAPGHGRLVINEKAF